MWYGVALKEVRVVKINKITDLRNRVVEARKARLEKVWQFRQAHPEYRGRACPDGVVERVACSSCGQYDATRRAPRHLPPAAPGEVAERFCQLCYRDLRRLEQRKKVQSF